MSESRPMNAYNSAARRDLAVGCVLFALIGLLPFIGDPYSLRLEIGRAHV